MVPKEVQAAIRLELLVGHDMSRARDGSAWDADLIVNGVRHNAEIRRVDPARVQGFRIRGLEGVFALEVGPHRD